MPAASRAAERGVRGRMEWPAEQGQGPLAHGLRRPSAWLLRGSAPGAAPPRLPPEGRGACHTSFTSVQTLCASSQTPSASPAAVETASPAPPLCLPDDPSSGNCVFVGSPYPRAHGAHASRSQAASPDARPRVVPPPLTASLTSIASLLLLLSASPARTAPP